MDGEIDLFVHAWLRAGGPTSASQSMKGILVNG